VLAVYSHLVVRSRLKRLVILTETNSENFRLLDSNPYLELEARSPDPRF
jgi:hypothetical protein